MLYPDVQTTIFDTFNGAILRLGAYSTPKENGLLARNCLYNKGQFGKRLGHSSVVVQADGQITDIVNWYFFAVGAPASVVTYYAPSIGVKGWQQGGGGFTGTFMSQTGAGGCSMITAGERLYGAFHDSTGRLGIAGGQVYGWNIGADPLFAAPLTNAISASETGAGLCTAGTRRIGYLTTTRNGYTGNLSPIAAGVFTPIEFASTGSKNLTLSVAGALPSYMIGGTIQIIMTTTKNLNTYYTVPGATNIATNPTNITLSISDDDLAANGTDVTANMDLIVSGSGSPAFRPSALFTYSNRMAYITLDALGNPAVYASDQNAYQIITQDQHLIQLEGEHKAVGGFSLRGVCYLSTQFELFSCEDNGRTPSTWIPPQKIDGSIGILAPNCVTANPSLGYAAIASQKGFYLFTGGIFPPLPISYFEESDWQRINWNVPTKIKVADDQLNRRFLVLVPLDGATTPTHIMSFDYTDGTTPDTIKYSLNNISSYALSCFGIIQNLSNSLQEVWYAPNVNGAFIRQNDGSETFPYRDIATNGTTPVAINCFYKTSIAPGPNESASTLHNFAGMHLEARGAGTGVNPAYITLKACGNNDVLTVTPRISPLPVTTAPGKEYRALWNLTTEQQTIEMSNANLDEWFQVSLIRVYWTVNAGQR